MLVLFRRPGEQILLRDRTTGELLATVKVVRSQKSGARIGLEADAERVRITREEVDAGWEDEKKTSSSSSAAAPPGADSAAEATAKCAERELTTRSPVEEVDAGWDYAYYESDPVPDPVPDPAPPTSGDDGDPADPVAAREAAEDGP
jgi:sRNA-binding carbon storage regulator CsrA